MQGTLNNRRIDVVAPLLTGFFVTPSANKEKHPVPDLSFSGIGVFFARVSG